MTEKELKVAPTTFANMDYCLEKGKVEWNNLTSVANIFEIKNNQ